jgi:hypothetical protein
LKQKEKTKGKEEVAVQLIASYLPVQASKYKHVGLWDERVYRGR